MRPLFPESAILVFCKAPLQGQVKTRLQPTLSLEQAVAAHIELTHLTLQRCKQKPLCNVHLVCAPDINHPFFQECAETYCLILSQQLGNDLGARMSNAFCKAFSAYRHVLLIGCDCPSLKVAELELALFELSNGRDLVIAPSEDGGYVLIGLNNPQPTLFTDMPWSTDRVMSETRYKAKQSLLNVYELPEQWDVDTPEDWQRYQKLYRNKPVLLGVKSA